MKWNITANNSTEVAKTTSLIDLLLNEANEQKRAATISEAIKADPRAVTQALANFMETSKLVSAPADREKHDVIIIAIQEAQKVALEITRTTSQTLASSPNTATVEAAKLADAKLATGTALVKKVTKNQTGNLSREKYFAEQNVSWSGVLTMISTAKT